MNGSYRVHPYYYPTTVVFVDDNRNFLANLSLKLDEGLAYRLFESSTEALAYIEGHTRSSPPYQRCFSECPEHIGGASRDGTVRLSLPEFSREVYNPRRFEEISVLVADYDLPGMDGLELCRRLKDTNIKKILLTGVADEKDAVRAFNEGLIDQFIVKADPQVIDTVDRSIKTLQHIYFHKTSVPILQALDGGAIGCLHDPDFVELFHGVCTERCIVEYYLLSDPAGFLLLDAEGRACVLMVPSDEDFAAHWEIARDEQAPASLLDQLERRSVIPYFWNNGGYYSAECADWERYVYPARRFGGARTYHYAVLDDPPCSLASVEDVMAYDRFLEALDGTPQFA